VSRIIALVEIPVGDTLEEAQEHVVEIGGVEYVLMEEDQKFKVRMLIDTETGEVSRHNI